MSYSSKAEFELSPARHRHESNLFPAGNWIKENLPFIADIELKDKYNPN